MAIPSLTVDSQSPSEAMSGVRGAPITVNSVGLNFGAILQPYTDSPYNGGYGLQLPSFIANSMPTPSTEPGGTGFVAESQFAKAIKQPHVYIPVALLALGIGLFAMKVFR